MAARRASTDNLSGWARDGNYSLEAFAVDVAALAAAMPEPPAIVGASMGGLSPQLALGELDPPPASALVLVHIATRMDPTAVTRIVTFMTAHPDGFASLEDAANASRPTSRTAPARPICQGCARTFGSASTGAGGGTGIPRS